MKEEFQRALEETRRQLATYYIGTTAPHYVPNEMEPKNMVRIVAYDITEPKRLRLVAKCCEDYGYRVEKSVFECDLDQQDFQSFWSELIGLIDHDEDALLSYRVCKSCVHEIQSAGVVDRPQKRLAYIF